MTAVRPAAAVMGALAVAAGLVAVPAVPARAADVVHVPAQAATIQEGIDTVADGGTVLVARGTYDENVVFKGKRAEVRSAAGPLVTVIDGGGRGAVVTFRHGETRDTLLRGFTVRNGVTGIDIAFSAPTIAGNIITGNQAYEGAGLWIADAAPLVEANVIRANVATAGGGGLRIGGASGTEIVGNLIEGNTAVWGGGMQLWTSWDALIWNNVFRANRAGRGGAIDTVNYSDPWIVQNLFAGNHADGAGGAVSLQVPLGFQGPTLVNNTMVGNRSPEGAAIHSRGDFLAQNNIMANAPGDTTPVAVCESAPRYVANDVYNGTPAPMRWCPDVIGLVGNVSVDPQLRPDHTLDATSPLIDAGLVDPLLPRLPPYDAGGSARVTDGDGDGVAAVDLGMFERPGRGFTARPEATPSSLDFGEVGVGSAATRTVVVWNSGLGPLEPGAAAVSGPGLFVAADGCRGRSLEMGQACEVTVGLFPPSSGPVSGTLTVPAGTGPHAVPVAGLAVAAPPPPPTPAPVVHAAPSSRWAQPGTGPLDGLGSWVAVAADPAAGPGQLPPSWLFGHAFGFEAGSALGVVGLVADPAGRFALLHVVGPDGTPHTAAVPFAWEAGRFYLPVVHRLGPGVWGAWVYDHGAGTWVAVGQVALPTAWGGLAPTSTTFAAWYGPPAAACSAYPRADVLFHPPTGFAAATTSVATLSAMAAGEGGCPAQASVDQGVWARYRLGS